MIHDIFGFNNPLKTFINIYVIATIEKRKELSKEDFKKYLTVENLIKLNNNELDTAINLDLFTATEFKEFFNLMEDKDKFELWNRLTSNFKIYKMDVRSIRESHYYTSEKWVKNCKTINDVFTSGLRNMQIMKQHYPFLLKFSKVRDLGTYSLTNIRFEDFNEKMKIYLPLKLENPITNPELKHLVKLAMQDIDGSKEFMMEQLKKTQDPIKLKKIILNNSL